MRDRGRVLQSCMNIVLFTFLASSMRAQAPVVTGSSAQLSWSASARASTYDLALGTTRPPRLYAAGLSATAQTVNGLASGTTYYWSVTAHASCDPARTTPTIIQSFTTSGACAQPASVVQIGPGDGEHSVSPTATLSWNAVAGAAGYDLYLGNGSAPALYMADVEQTSMTIPRLSADTEYSWKVIARAACDPSKNAVSSVRRFVVSTCGASAPPAMVSAPQANVAVGATYTISWGGAAGMDAAASYLVERAADPQFSTITDHQQTTATSASFTSAAAGSYYHRVTSIAGCDAKRRSPPSTTSSVSVTPGPSVIIFTMQPLTVITKLGDKLEDQRARFALENLSSAPIEVLIATGGQFPVPFFTIVDPFGGDSGRVSLQPRQAKTFDIHFSGPPNDQAGAYQGHIYITSSGQPLAFTPQAYVNLKVGSNASAAAPKLLVNGMESDFAFFPPVSGDDSARPALSVDLLNSGSVPMEVGGEIGPEAWLKMEKDWNSSPVPPSAFRTLRLSTQRTRALAGSALPRYTYLTVRNKSGQSARLLVEDNGGVTTGRGRNQPLGAGELSLIVPSIRSGSGGATVLYLTNTGAAALPLDLIWTPEGVEGFDSGSVMRISLVVPPNDVVRLTDPLAQIFATTGDAIGSLEIRSAPEKLGSLVVRSEVRSPVTGGGSYGYAVPIVLRAEGARSGAPQRVVGVASDTAVKTALVLTETSGRDKATAHVTLYDKSGSKRGEQTFAIGRYGSKRIDDIGPSFGGGTDVQGGYMDVEVTSDGGAVIALATVADRSSGSGATFVSQPIGSQAHLSSLGRRIATLDTTSAAGSRRLLVGGVISDGSSITTLGITAAANTNAKITYRDATTGRSFTQNAMVAAGAAQEYVDVVQAISGSSAPSHGTVTIDSDREVGVYARVKNAKSIDSLPVVSPYAEALTGSGAAKPIYAEGLEQSIDPTKGRRTSLVLSEMAGQSATVTVRLYEPGSRSAAIAEKDFPVAANGETRLDDLFASMSLLSGPDDLQQRLKDRVNVACTVTPKSGTGLISGLAIITDNRTGDRRIVQLQPAGALPATAPQRIAVPSTPGRRRAAGR